MKENIKNILILGTGLVSQPLIDFLLTRIDNHITLSSNDLTQADSINRLTLATHPDRLKLQLIDVISENEKLSLLIKEHHLIISLLPAFLHLKIAKLCLYHNKHFLTTSYLSDELTKMNKEVKDKNLIFMNECGINPGLDHVIAYKVIKEQENLGNYIIGYESWCGAIPAPEHVDNPLLYKFSWCPKGALLALINEARQLINGRVIKINERQLLTSSIIDKNFHPSLNLEGYYNRDSLKYKQLYNLNNAKSVIRGIIRYQGFTFVIQCFKNLQLFSLKKIENNIITWRDYLNIILKNPRNEDTIYDVKNKYFSKGYELFIRKSTLSDTLAERKFYLNLSLLCISDFEDKYIKKYNFETLFNRIYSTLVFLDLYNENNKVIFYYFFILFINI